MFSFHVNILFLYFTYITSEQVYLSFDQNFEILNHIRRSLRPQGFENITSLLSTCLFSRPTVVFLAHLTSLQQALDQVSHLMLLDASD